MNFPSQSGANQNQQDMKKKHKTTENNESGPSDKQTRPQEKEKRTHIALVYSPFTTSGQEMDWAHSWMLGS